MAVIRKRKNLKIPKKSLQPSLPDNISRGSNIMCIVEADKVYCKMIHARASKLMACKDIDTFKRHMKGLAEN